MEPILLQNPPNRPWSIVASDLFSLKGVDYIVIVDAYSGYFDFQVLPSLTSAEIIKSLKKWFATFGIPDILRTDNGKQYDCHECKTFSQDWKFEHKTSSPYFPRSNGLAERYVQEAKNLLRRCIEEKSDVQLALLHHRNTPRGNLASPVQRLMGRRTKTLLPVSEKLLQPKIIKNVRKTILQEKVKEKKYSDKSKVMERRKFNPGDNIMLREGKRHWVPAKVIKASVEPRSYMVGRPDGAVYRRNSWFLTPAPAGSNEHLAQTQTEGNATKKLQGSSNNALERPSPPLQQPLSPQRPQLPPAQGQPAETGDPTTTPIQRSPAGERTTRSGRQVIAPKRYHES